MDFAFSEEQQMLRSSARDFLGDRLPIETVVQLADSDAGWDPKTWPTLVELGWLELEDFLDEAVLFEESGRALLPAPFFSTVALARPMHTGDRPATLAWAEDTAPHLSDLGLGVATNADSNGRLTGTKRLVPDLGSAEVVVVVADDGLYSVDVSPELVVPRSTMDRTRRLADLVLDGTPGERIGDLDSLREVRLRALAALACEGVGVAQKALEYAADYTKQRQQFGRVIGTYQAVSHQVADIYSALELARSLAYWASWAVSVGDESAANACAAAKSAAGEAAVVACEKAIQVHGGIGFTWEHALHRYYKRAQWIDAFDGYGRTQRADIAAVLLDGEPPALADVPEPAVVDGPSEQLDEGVA